MLYTEQTKKAMRLCYEAHQGVMDRGGVPYVFHPFHLAEQMTTEDETIAALLHDVVEDTAMRLEDIASMGFPKTALEALRLLTHDRNEDYIEYVCRIGANPVAAAVKMADLAHNSDLTRLDAVDDNALRRAKKYRLCLHLLKTRTITDGICCFTIPIDGSDAPILLKATQERLLSYSLNGRPLTRAEFTAALTRASL